MYLFTLNYCLSLIFFVGMIKIIFNKSYFLISLLSLEFCGLGVYCLISLLSGELGGSYYMNFYILSLMVCESSLGLSLLVLLSHSKSSSQIVGKVNLLC